MITNSEDESIGRGNEAWRREAGLGITILGSPEEQDMGLGLVDLVVDPSSRLLHAEGAPLLHRDISTCSVSSRARGMRL